jgi:hypothetical protein
LNSRKELREDDQKNFKITDDYIDLEHCPSIGEPFFDGLQIEGDLEFDSTITVIFMPLASLASIFIVIMAWFIYGYWSVAWNFGACFVPILTGLGNWLLHEKGSR